ncbi:MAG: hypothetical protein ACLF0P_17430 [Thermoanaerobaculia bacterium]
MLPFPLADLIVETTTTEGLGDLFLEGPQAGLGATLAERLGDGEQTFFCCFQAGVAWEVFKGTVHDEATDRVTRDEFVASSTGSTVNFGAGTKNVFTVLPASQSMLAARALQEVAEAGLESAARGNLGVTAKGDELVTAADASAVRTAAELGTVATRDVGVGADAEVPDRGLADGRYSPLPSGAYVDFPTDGSVKLPFYMSSAPPGWVRETGSELHDTMIRMVTTGGGSAVTTGRDGVSTPSTEPTQLTTGHLPPHDHSFDYDLGILVDSGSQETVVTQLSGGNTKDTTNTGSGFGHDHGIRLRYADFLVARFTG